MNSRDSEHFRQLLVSRRDQLLAISETAEEAAGTVELDQSRVGRLSRMDAMQQQAMAVATGQRRKLDLKRIAAALKRVDSDAFGYCLECDEEIARGRMEFDPSVTLCIDCAD